MPKQKDLCSAWDCLLRTCEHHHCHYRRWMIEYTVWQNYAELGCLDYKSFNKIETILEPYRDDYDDEEEDYNL